MDGKNYLDIIRRLITGMCKTSPCPQTLYQRASTRDWLENLWWDAKGCSESTWHSSSVHVCQGMHRAQKEPGAHGVPRILSCYTAQ